MGSKFLPDLLSDEQLVAEVQQGNIAAFEALVKRYQQRLFTSVYRICQNADDAEEIVQDTFLSIYKTIDKIDCSRKFSPYLFGAAKNTAISYLRKSKDILPLFEDVEPESDLKLEELLIERETNEKVREALENLRDVQKEILKLYYFDDLSYEEISSKLFLPINTVRTHLRRGKMELAKRLTYEPSFAKATEGHAS